MVLIIKSIFIFSRSVELTGKLLNIVWEALILFCQLKADSVLVISFTV